MSWEARTAGGLALLLVAACSSGTADRSADGRPRESADSPPFEFVGATAALGDQGDVVMLEEEQVEVFEAETSTPQTSDWAQGAAVRHRDGTWTRLPDPPTLVAADLVPVGDTVAVVGVACTASPCGKGLKTGALLSEDFEGWDDFVFDDGLGDGPINAGGDGSMQALADGWARGGRGFWSIATDGAVRFALYPRDESPAGGGRHFCTRGADLVSVAVVAATGDPLTVPQGPRQLVGAIRFDATDPGAAWTETAPPPEVVLDDPHLFCIDDGLVTLALDTELTWSADSGTWTQRSISFPHDASPERVLGESHLLGDGTVVFEPNLSGTYPNTEAVEGLILRRPDGSYEVTDIVVDDLFVAGNQAYGLTNVEQSTRRPPRHRTTDIELLDLDA